jgi:phosphomannomutase
VKKRGRSAKMDIVAEYTHRIAGDAKLARPMKIVVDSRQRHAGRLRARRCCARWAARSIELYCEVDGDFPNHHPDPSKPENLADLHRAR